MDMKSIKAKRIIIFTVLIMLLSTITVYASSGKASVTSNLTVGQTGSIKLSASAPGGFFQGSVSVADKSVIKVSSTTIFADTGTSDKANPSQTISFTALKAGKTTVTVKFEGESLAGDRFSYNKTFTVNVAGKSASKPKQSTPKPPQIDNTEQEKKTLEQIEKEELANRMKTPLIKEIDVISNSERLKGKSLLLIKPESEKFEYSGELPRNIDKISLKISTIKDDVVLDYPQDITIDQGKGSVEFVIKATQDKLVQEFKIKLTTPEDSKFQINDGTRKLELMVDPYLDTVMEELGFTKVFINKEEPSQGFYYTMDKKNYAVAVDEENNAYVYLLDEKNNPIKEVFLVSNKDKQVFILVNETLDEVDQTLLKGNPYEEQEITISKLLTDLDPTIKFNNRINGWTYDEEAIVTHGLISKDESELVYVDSSSNVKSAFVEFDEIGTISEEIIQYGGYGLWIITLIIFLIYRVTRKPKRRRSRSDAFAE